MELFDTHAHLNFPEFEQDLDEVMDRCAENEVAYVLNVGIDVTTSEGSLSLARERQNVFCSVGVHPHDALTVNDDAIAALRGLAADGKVVALGEIGLDFYRDLSPREVQREAFRRQITLALELGLPLIIHSRDAHREVMDIMEREGARDVGGVMHCFPGDWEMAAWCLDRGFLIGIGGAVTFNKSDMLRDVARKCPKDGLLLETDCPFLSPEPTRGKRNEPAHIRVIAEFIAGLRRMPLEELAHCTTGNAFKLFGLG